MPISIKNIKKNLINIAISKNKGIPFFMEYSVKE